jgi:hypothetical protein
VTTSEFRACHIERAGVFDLPFSREAALAYLSPEGEREWVPGWLPVYLHPGAADSAPGTVFRTSHNSQETIWLVLEYDPAEGRALYGRFTEESHIGTVAVECRESGSHRTEVRVAYALTSTTPTGTKLLEAMTEAAYATMLQEWRRLILAAHTGKGA